MSLILPSKMPTWRNPATSKWKIELHTIEGTSFSFRFPVHGGINGRDKRCEQTKSFDRSAAGLQHPPGTPPTNTAGALQFELAGFTDPRLADKYHWPHMADWPDDWVDFIAEMLAPVHKYFAIPVIAAPLSWTTPGDRFSSQGFIDFGGITIHGQAPNQPSGHWDGTNFRIERYMSTVNAILHGAPPQHPPQKPPEDDMAQPTIQLRHVEGSDTRWQVDLVAGTKHNVGDKAALDELHAQAYFGGVEIKELTATKHWLDSLKEI